MTINIKMRSNKESKNAAHKKIWMKFTVVYSFFMFSILILITYLHSAAEKISAEEFWHRNFTTFQNSVTLLDNNFTIIDHYCRQLLQNQTFLRLSKAEDSSRNSFFLNGYRFKSELPSYLATYPGIPVSSYFILLRNTGYTASINSFKTEELYYKRYYPSSIPEYDVWRSYLYDDNGSGTLRYVEGNMTAGNDGTFLYLVDIDALSYKEIPATACFHINFRRLKSIFSGNSLQNGGCLLVLDNNNMPVFYFTEDGTGQPPLEETEFAALPGVLSTLTYINGSAALSFSGRLMHVTMCRSTLNGWSYYLVQPESICAGPYRAASGLILALAAVIGLFLTAVLVKNSMRPIMQLDSRLQETITDRNQLKEAVDAAKPLIYENYLRQLLTGNVSSPEELAYIRKFLRLENENLRFYVMYGIVYENEPADGDGNSLSEYRGDIRSYIHEALAEYFSYGQMLYLFSPKKRVYSLLLPFMGEDEKTLIAIQEKVLKLHERLLSEDSIWFFTGIGLACPFSNIWESYQQAKDASRYTSKSYIFLPYEMLKKSSQAYYYPIEFSSRLIQFITAGNKAQVGELFDLIQRENMEERSLSLTLLNFLLSDIRNTLLRARFAISENEKTDETKLADIDAMLMAEDISFRSCEEIALKLCCLHPIKTEKTTLIDTIVAYIRANYTDPSLGLNKISDEFHISESYFSHMFKETMNVNFSVYLEDLRLNEAARLLKEGNTNYSGISEQVGYNNINSFRRAFKKKFGVTPSAMTADSQ